MKVVLKLGGSLIDRSSELIKAISDHFAATEGNMQVIIVPGGGIFADTIRRISKEYSLTEKAAHWMAIAAMEQYAHLLEDLSSIPTIENTSNINANVSILLPYRLLKDTDELPHSWDVTSDTIAAWVAQRMSARLVKATDVDGIFNNGKMIEEITLKELEVMGETCADRMLSTMLIKHGMECVIVNGDHPERVIAAIEGKKVIGTYIKGNA
ncbi:amino acid kinase [Methanococcoides burtonii]|uniref:Amino acid kinase n=1 Tax=Methanococcoides burtonii (strain DSM 6242 / NBRC 107633 / OCM 468 / ACE-M) TaxID=259564 RepID=Q12WE1_METBU|nr:amino acid kinase [Methanococcoides burtonii]ABE52235.1 amino acid kinase [Methanococcoides burtonii DSM 6242]